MQKEEKDRLDVHGCNLVYLADRVSRSHPR